MHLTQEELAEMCELSPRHVSNIESGKANPKLDTVMALCSVCDINAGELPRIKTNEEERTYGIPLPFHGAAVFS